MTTPEEFLALDSFPATVRRHAADDQETRDHLS